MERRFAIRKQELLAECQVSPRVFQHMVERLEQFAEPFVTQLVQPAQRVHARTYLQGLLSNLERKNVESIAYRDDQDRRNLQHFIGTADWDHRPLQQELTRQVGRELGEADGVIVFDPSAFVKKGRQSVGVSRQWCGRLGKVDNCQVAVYMGYATRREHVLLDARLYVPKEWAADRKRRRAAGVPRGLRFQTRHTQALEMLQANRAWLPHAWVAGDDEFGMAAAFRRDLHALGETYLLAVPSTMTIRDLDATPPTYQGRGAVPKRPFVQMCAWREALPEAAWTRIDVRDGAKGPLTVDVVQCRVQTKIKRRCMTYDEVLVIVRSRDEDGTTKHDYYLSNAPPDTPLAEFARVTKAAHRIEECIQRAKSEAGLADYEVRHWQGWHHHQILSLLATWFLVREARRGKKMDAGDHRAADPRWLGATAPRPLPIREHCSDRPRQDQTPAPKRRGAAVPLEIT